MKTLRSYVRDGWFEADSGFAPLVDPCTEETIAVASSAGIDFEAVLEHARSQGGPALREMTFAQRGTLLLEMSRALQGARDDLIELSMRNTGTTRKDSKFDVDGGIYTLAHYAEIGASLGDRKFLLEGEGIQLARSARLRGQHVRRPLQGAAIHVNAFNFPIWGFAEKAACALLAGVAVITKPATSSALVTERAMEVLVDADLLPRGSFSLICGSVGDLIDRLGFQDALAFTGSASTAMKLRGKSNLLESSTRINVEADSLNAAVLAPDVEPGTETWNVFVHEVAREITQKTGQKCTAVRRILVPRDKIDEAQRALIERLEDVVVGNPEDRTVSMGPLATPQQLDEAVSGVGRLVSDAELVLGDGARIDGVGSDAGKGFFFAPTLLRAADARRAASVHQHEVFGPAATLLPYDGTAAEGADIVALAGGTLVTSVYGNDRTWLAEFLERGGGASGRVYIGSEKVASQLPGSGLAMPHLNHGGPGRAGGGTELGGISGLDLYLERVAISGDRGLIERLTGSRE